MKNYGIRVLAGLGLLALLAFPTSVVAQCDLAPWTATLTPTDSITSAGVYQGGVSWGLESFSALELEPSATATFQVVDGLGPYTLELGTTRRLVVTDSTPGLAPNGTGGDPFYVRREGAITATGWVDQQFCDLVVEGDVNTEGGPGGRGSGSRQGLLARWDKGNNFYWFFLNFASGQYAIWRAKHLGEQLTLPGSLGTVGGFDATRPYRLRFRLAGDTLRGWVYRYQNDGTLVQVGDTGNVVDSDPQLQGVSGFLAELAMEQPFGTLDAGFANLSSTPLTGGVPSPSLGLDPGATGPATTARFEPSAAWTTNTVDDCDTATALMQYDQVLQVYPNHVPSLNGKAWLLATAEDPVLRDPAQSLDLALQAFNEALESNNTRHEAEVQTVYGRGYMVELAYTLGAAYASLAKWDPIDDILGYDTNASSAIATVEWALEIAEALNSQSTSNYSQELVQYGQRSLSSYSGRTPLLGERRPGSGDGVGSCPTTAQPTETTTLEASRGVAPEGAEPEEGP